MTAKNDVKSAKLTKAQKETFDNLMSKGCKHYPEDGLPNVVWFMNHCILINKDGSTEDL